MTIDFYWQGSSDKKVFDHWEDGLQAAMKIIEQKHTVNYLEPWDESKGDVVLYWEACCCAKGPDAEHYNKIRKLDKPKILLFAGGPIDYLDAVGFDLYLVESEINEKEFEALELPWRRAFGVNTEVMKPMNLEKKYAGFFQATFADWKRHSLFAQAMGSTGAVAGRLQENDRQGYYDCQDLGVTIFSEQSAEDIAKLINESQAVVNTSSYWGGGQRTTLEAMACDVPPVVMSDSPKNCEYVLESGFGVISEPTPEAIREATKKTNGMKGGREYIMSKWSEKHYADAIMSAINEII